MRVILSIALLLMVAPLHAAGISVIPLPEQVRLEEGMRLLLPGRIALSIEGAVDKTIESEFKKIFPDHMFLWGEKKNPDFVLRLVDGFSPEAYHLNITPNSCIIEASDNAGIFYALQTLIQLAEKQSGGVALPIVDIRDRPAFTIRGFMHDTGRNFQTVESLKEQLNLFAAFKINTFHWHLTDYPAWRPQSKIYPALNTPLGRNPLRDPDKSYTFDEIRDVIAYAKARHIRIIPELDMPGHSAFFKPVFGYEMGTPQGIETLKELIKEFCAEIPAEDCPILHIGSDEVRIQDPARFMREIETTVRACGRTPMVWAPGLKPFSDKTIRQIWSDGEIGNVAAKGLPNPIIDSAAGYLNLFDPQIIVQRHYYHPIGGVSRGTEKSIGGILCCWPDARVEDKSKIFSQSAVWPALLAFAESTWRGKETVNHNEKLQIPVAGDPAFADFEARMITARDRFFADRPFDYIPMHRHTWHATKTTLPGPDAAIEAAGTIAPHPTRLLRGASFLFANRGARQLYGSKVGNTVYLTTTFTLAEPRTVYFRTGFDSPTRSNRYAGGIPPAGELDSNGGDIFLNGKPLPRPTYEHPGKFRFARDTWFDPANEIPFIDEEMFWLREPIAVTLPAGTHTLFVRVVQALPKQIFAVTCLPVKKAARGWVDDTDITFIAP